MSPSDIATVCHGELSVTCSVNASFLEWIVTFPHFKPSVMRLISSSSLDGVLLMPQTVNNTVFHFFKLSNRRALPLISRILIKNVSTDLNTSNVTCKEVNNLINDTQRTLVTTVHITDHGMLYIDFWNRVTMVN